MSRRFLTLIAVLLLNIPFQASGEGLGIGPTEHFNIDIPAQPLSSALRELARQTGLQIAVQSALTAGKVAPALKGTYGLNAALTALLKDTGLEAYPVNEHTRGIREVHAREEGRSSTPATPAGEGGAVSERISGGAMPEILVKGSKILNVDVVRTEEDAQPYTILRSEQIEQSGAQNVEEFLKQQLTMNTTEYTSSQGVGAGNGTLSSINLRGLGPGETLILIDGRRSASVALNGANTQPDINGIPLSAIERIEVLPSSASAIYGGGAMGGVVNIVLKKNFNGGDFRHTYDQPTGSSARQRSVYASYGSTFSGGRTQIMVAGQYSDGSAPLAQDRLGLIERGLGAILQNSPSYLYRPPAGPFQGTATNIASSEGTLGINSLISFTPLTLRNGTPLNSPITWVSAGTAPGSDPSAGLVANAGRYNLGLAPGYGAYGLQSSLGTTPQTKSLIATIRQALFDDVQLFAELSTISNSSRVLDSPFDQDVFTVPAGAPTNPFQQTVSVSFPTTCTSLDTSDSVTQSATLGVLAPLGSTWGWELDYTWSRNSYEYAAGRGDYVAVSSALSAGILNPFVDTIAHPLDLSPYVGSESLASESALYDLDLRLNGTVGSIPAGRPTLTVGIEHRREAIGNQGYSEDYPLTPAISYAQRYFGQSQSTDSLYLETLVPLVAAQNHLPAVRTLALQLAGRTEHYTVNAGTPYTYLTPSLAYCCNPPQGQHSTIEYTSTNPTIALKLEPVAGVTLRASYASAFLPPTAAQLLRNPVSVCGGGACERIIDPRNGDVYGVTLTAGGNPDLQPQSSKTWDLGLILTPQIRALQGLRLDLEHYSITQPNFITTPSAQQVLDDPALASRVTRDPTTGRVTLIDMSYLNANQYKTGGWDLRADYSRDTGVGMFGLHAAATWVSYDLRQFSIGSAFLEYAGYPNDGGETKLKSNASFDWAYHGWRVAWSATYYSSYRQEFSPGSPTAVQFPSGNVFVLAAQGSNSIPSQIYHDLFVSYVFDRGGHGNRAVNAALSDLTVQLGIRNVFNTLPPFDASFYPYYFSPYGDARLRDYRVTLKKSF